MDHVRYSSGRSAYDTPPSAHGRALRPPSVRYPNRTGQCSNCQLETSKLDWMTPIAPSWRTDVGRPHLIWPRDEDVAFVNQRSPRRRGYQTILYVTRLSRLRRRVEVVRSAHSAAGASDSYRMLCRARSWNSTTLYLRYATQAYRSESIRIPGSCT